MNSAQTTTATSSSSSTPHPFNQDFVLYDDAAQQDLTPRPSQHSHHQSQWPRASSMSHSLSSPSSSSLSSAFHSKPAPSQYFPMTSNAPVQQITPMSQPSQAPYSSSNFTLHRAPPSPGFTSPILGNLDETLVGPYQATQQSHVTPPTSSHPNATRKRARGHNHTLSWEGGIDPVQHAAQHMARGVSLGNNSRRGSRNSIGSARVSGSIFDGSPPDGQDSSPQLPASGSFGPPIQSLSIGGTSNGGMQESNDFGSLFPSPLGHGQSADTDPVPMSLDQPMQTQQPSWQSHEQQIQQQSRALSALLPAVSIAARPSAGRRRSSSVDASVLSTLRAAQTEPNHSAPRRQKLVRDRSGLTMSPKEAFLDYDDVNSNLSRSGFNESSSLFAVRTGPALGPSQGVDRGGQGKDGPANVNATFPAAPRPIHKGGAMDHNSNVDSSQFVGSLQSQDSSSSTVFSPSDSLMSGTTEDDEDDEDEDEQPFDPRSVGPFPIITGDDKHGKSAEATAAAVAAEAPHKGLWGLDPWNFHQQRDQQPHGQGGKPHPPRFSVVSTSSSDSEDDVPLSRITRRPDSSRDDANSSQPLESSRDSLSSSSMMGSTGSRRRVPGTMGGYGYMAGSQESGLSLADAASSHPTSRSDLILDPSTVNRTARYGDDRNRRASTTSLSESVLSLEDPPVSPSIRSSAQSIPSLDAIIFPSAHPSLQRPGAQGATQSARQPGTTRKSTEQDREMEPPTSAEADEEDVEDDDSDDGDFEESGGAASNARGRGAGGRKGAATTNKRRSGGAAGRRSGSGSRAYGAGRSPTRAGGTAAQHNSSGSTLCDYISPLRPEAGECGTAFHRPYDLLRHRETIHARDEAAAVRRGEMTMEQCVVLGKEVDPAKSDAAIEWKCDGPKGCGSSFSRKDALLRHRRLRDH